MTKDAIQTLVDEMACAACFTDKQILYAILERISSGVPVTVSISIGDDVTGGTEGSILFIGPGGTIAQDNANLFFNQSAGSVGLGTNTPSRKFHVAEGNILMDKTGISGFGIKNNAATFGATLIAGSSGNPNFYANITLDDVQDDPSKVSLGIRLSVTNDRIEFLTRTAGGSFGAAKLVFTGAGRLGVATTAPDKICEINLGTTDALRLTYNDSNGGATTYMDTTVSSVGLTTFTAVGSAPAFLFPQKVTHTGSMIVKSVTDAGPMTATAGTVAEIVFNTSDSKFYGCTVTGSPATWAALN